MDRSIAATSRQNSDFLPLCRRKVISLRVWIDLQDAATSKFVVACRCRYSQ